MSDVFTTQEGGWGGDEWAKRLVERVRQNPLRRTRGVSDKEKRYAVLDKFYAQHYGSMEPPSVVDGKVIDAMADRIVALTAAVEELRALHVVIDDWCYRCNCVAPCSTLRALEGTP